MQMTQTQFNSLAPEMQQALTAQGIQVVPDNQQPSTMPQQPQTAFAGGWAPQQPASSGEWVSTGVPVAVETENGECTVYLNFVGVQSPSQVGDLVRGLIAKGVPVKTWKKKSGKW